MLEDDKIMLKLKLKSVFSDGYRKTMNTKLYASFTVSGNKHRAEINTANGALPACWEALCSYCR